MKSWYCIYTKVNQEDIVSGKLGDLPEIEVLNPKIAINKRRAGKQTEAIEGLFPGYIFSRLDLCRYFHLITYTRGVRRFVGNGSGMPYAVDEKVIDCIRSRMNGGVIRCESPKLTPGDKVTVVSGPFSGLTGLFLSEMKPRERISILLDTLACGARVEIERDLVEVCSSDKSNGALTHHAHG